MNAWTNDKTGHNRDIDTGPTPDGSIDNLTIRIEYVEHRGAGNLHKAIALDGHVIPLILRVPEMRDTLRELREWIWTNKGWWITDNFKELNSILARIDDLIAPTEQEAENGA